MIERCTKKRMLISIVLLTGLSIAIVLLEHHLTQNSHLIHSHSTPTDQGATPTVSSHNNCWRTENFSVIEDCQPCTDFEKTSKNIASCATNGYKEKVNCAISGETFRSCARVLWLDEKRFWTLEICCLVFGIISSCFVVWRQKILEHQMMRKIQQQISMN